MKNLLLTFVAVAVAFAAYAGPHSKEYLDKKKCFDQYEQNVKKANSCEDLETAKNTFVTDLFLLLKVEYAVEDKISESEDRDLEDQLARIQSKVEVLKDHWDCEAKESNDATSDDVKTVEEESEDETIYSIVEEMPEFPGGTEKLYEYLSKNLRYPNTAIESHIQGRIMVSFVVETDGSISNVKVMRSLDKDCDEEAVRIVKAMPNWRPGKMRGKPVRVSYMIPITFRL